MPITIDNGPIFRVKLGDVNIREIRKGSELEWGLYEITYTNKGPKDIDTGFDSENNIPNYVWGYPDYKKSIEDGTLEPNDFNLFIPDNASAEEAKSALGNNYGYRSHSDGWFSDNNCLIFFPAITHDFHRDLDIFCKWRQRKYCFNGTYAYEHEEKSEYTIYAFKKRDGSGGYEDGYYDDDLNLVSIDGDIVAEEEV